MDAETIVPGAGAGGDGGGEGGGGTAVVDPPVVVDEPILPGAGEGEGGDAAGGDEPAPEDKPAEGEGDEPTGPDGAKIDDPKVKAAIAKFKKMDPAAAKVVAEDHFKRTAFEKEFPTVQAAREAKATLEAVGGHEGIEKMETEIADWQKEADQFAAGDPALIENLYNANPDALVNTTQTSLDFIKSKSLEKFDQALIPHLVDRLTTVGFKGTVTALAKLIEEGKGQEAYDLVSNMGTWFKDLEDKAKKFGENRTKVDPKEQAMSEREKAVQQKEAAGVDREISNNVTRLNNGALGKLVEPLAKQLKLPLEGKREFTQGLAARIYAAMKADKVFQRNARAIKGKGDLNRSAEFISGKFQELLPDMFEKYRNLMYPNMKVPIPGAGAVKPKPGAPANNGKPAGQQPQPGAGAGDGFTMVNAKPKPEEIDWGPGKTTDEMFHIGRGIGRAIIKGSGKKIKWDWAKI